MKGKPIYVETVIKGDLEQIWKYTQTPNLHEQWDLRFSKITYLPKKEGDPQLFSYRTNIGFGLCIEGWGKSVGEHNSKDGSKTSSLQFGTEQRISIINEGRGYWKYVPKDKENVQFLTQYNYETNFGIAGRFFDRYIFRPMIGWATALSFDVLRRWIEKDETPMSQYLRFFTQSILAGFFMVLWLYHGLVPKLIAMHPTEVEMVTNLLPLSSHQGQMIVIIGGVGEIILGLIWMLYRNKKRLFWFQVVTFPLLMLVAVLAAPDLLTQPFNPFTFNLALFTMSMIGVMISSDIPSAKNCKRVPGGG